ncbi:MAG: response regulator [Pseudohongiellaceae bacterium]
MKSKPVLKRTVTVNILLIDDHTSFCQGLIAAISATRNDLSIRYESDPELAPTFLAGNHRYDLLIVDIMMPGLNGIDLIRKLNALGNFTPLMVMSSVEEPSVISELFGLGILGFVPKSYSVEEVLEAIDSCQAGEIHVPEHLRQCVPDNIATQVSSPSESGKQKHSDTLELTNRQVQILSLMNQGKTNQQMADELFISLATVKTHIHHLFKALAVNNRVSCLRAAKKIGSV